MASNYESIINLLLPGNDTQLTFRAADTIIRAVRDQNEGHEGHWCISVIDAMTGNIGQACVNDFQLSCLMFLALGGGEDANGDINITDRFYEVVEPIIKDWPKTVRPIP